MYEENHLLHHLRDASLGRESSLIARLGDNNSISYGDFFSGVERFAGALIDLGLKPGDRLTAQVEKSVEALQLYLGTVLAGGIYVPLNTAYTESERAYFIADSRPRLFVCDSRKKAHLANVRVETLDAEGRGSLGDAAAVQRPGVSGVARGKNDPAAILYTSGTTGRAKGAMLTHHNLASNAAVLRDFWKFDADDRLIHALPIFHTHGLFVAVNVTLCAAASLLFLRRFEVEEVLRALSHATVLMGVPTFYVRLLKHPGLDKEAGANMRLFISGSAPLSEATHRQWFERTGHEILERYGMTETGMNTSNPYDGVRRAGTVGLPLPGVSLRITESEGNKPLPHGVTGMIEVKGPSVFSGYWEKPEQTKEAFRDDGYFITGDLGHMDDQSYVSIVGRTSDLVICGGYNIYPREIETLLNDLSGVAESAVVGLPHPDLGEAVVAFIISAPGAAPTEEAMITALADRLARYKQPRKYFFVEDLPRNALGKVLKNRLRAQYGTLLTAGAKGATGGARS